MYYVYLIGWFLFKLFHTSLDPAVCYPDPYSLIYQAIRQMKSRSFFSATPQEYENNYS